MSDKTQHIAIFTTASLPWLTGTAINPLFRAAYLEKCGTWKVSLVVPWLSLDDQNFVYPNKISFASPEEHENYVRGWLQDRTGFISGFKIRFYPAKFSKEKRSILPVGDITEIIPDEDADIAVLEEPEHLTWYHHGRRWKLKFKRVIGIVHTNYLEYVKREKNGLVQAFFLKHINNWVTHIYCHKIIRLSAATQDLPRSIVCNVHGVNPKFLAIGKNQGRLAEEGLPEARAYYIGKMIWSKGYRELLQLLSDHQDKLSAIGLDLYGDGEDSDAVRKAAAKLKSDVRVFPGRDHADSLFNQYKVFVNPSTTDVVCTTTMEALAMGKIVVCAEHPSNDFFKRFANCRTYNNGKGFVAAVLAALNREVAPPLTKEEQRELSWEAATERFVAAAGLQEVMLTPVAATKFMWVSGRMKEMRRGVESTAALAHQVISGNETARRMFGAIPGSLRPDDQQRRELGLPS